MWNVFLDGNCVKSYPLKAQACMYCFMKGWVYSGWDDFKPYAEGAIVCLDPRVQIIEDKKGEKDED